MKAFLIQKNKIDNGGWTNIKATQLLDYERAVCLALLKCYKYNDIETAKHLLKVIENYADARGFACLGISTQTSEKQDYHFNLPIKSKNKNINDIFTRCIDKLSAEVKILIANQDNFSKEMQGYTHCIYARIMNILETHVDMILECMLYHRPDIYQKAFKELKRKFFDKSVLEMPPFKTRLGI